MTKLRNFFVAKSPLYWRICTRPILPVDCKFVVKSKAGDGKILPPWWYNFFYVIKEDARVNKIAGAAGWYQSENIMMYLVRPDK